MGNHRKLLVIMLALVMSVMMLMPSCSGGSGGGVSDIQQNVTVGRRVFVDDSGIVFFGYSNLICTAVLKDGEISEFVPEGATTGVIYTLAVYNDALYLSTSDGVYKYPLEIFTAENPSASPVKVLGAAEGPGTEDQFEIFDGKLFFTRDESLYCVPADGGEVTTVSSGVMDFEVSDQGIYFLDSSGKLNVMSPDLSESRALSGMGSAKAFTVAGPDLYYNGGDHVMAFNVVKEEASEVTTEYKAHESCTPWSNGTNTLYYNADWKTLIAGTGDEDTELYDHSYPGKYCGYMTGDQLLYLTGDTSNLKMKIFDLKGASFKEYDLAAEMKTYLDKIGGGDSDPEPQPEPEPKTGSGGYDIMSNFYRSTSQEGDIQYLYFNDFLLTLPNADDISYESHGDSVDIIFVPGKNAGYGGKLVTIRAYDLNDNSYQSLPDYHVGGVGGNTNKRFVAIYPTDLQCSPEFESVVARYKELKDYLYKIGEGAVNSPLQTSDSSPAPY